LTKYDFHDIIAIYKQAGTPPATSEKNGEKQMSATNCDKIRDYFYRQYELEKGSVKENIYALFEEDAIIQLADGNTVALEDVVRSVTMLREIPRSERIIEVSDLREEDDTVAFHSYIRFRNPETSEWSEMDSDAVWRFNGQGKVVESKSSASITSVMPPKSS
jgi:hypothetical protein